MCIQLISLPEDDCVCAYKCSKHSHYDLIPANFPRTKKRHGKITAVSATEQQKQQQGLHEWNEEIFICANIFRNPLKYYINQWLIATSTVISIIHGRHDSMR